MDDHVWTGSADDRFTLEQGIHRVIADLRHPERGLLVSHVGKPIETSAANMCLHSLHSPTELSLTDAYSRGTSLVAAYESASPAWPGRIEYACRVTRPTGWNLPNEAFVCLTMVSYTTDAPTCAGRVDLRSTVCAAASFHQPTGMQEAVLAVCRLPQPKDDGTCPTIVLPPPHFLLFDLHDGTDAVLLGHVGTQEIPTELTGGPVSDDQPETWRFQLSQTVFSEPVERGVILRAAVAAVIGPRESLHPAAVDDLRKRLTERGVSLNEEPQLEVES
ncbi:hypothetical protein JCM19992_24880 [Thermostilla marina]